MTRSNTITVLVERLLLVIVGAVLCNVYPLLPGCEALRNHPPALTAEPGYLGFQKEAKP